MAVSVRLGSTTMISGALRLRITRSQRMGWAMQTLDPIRTMQSDSSRS